MVSGADGDPFLIEYGPHVMRVHAFHHERDDACLLFRRANQAHAGQGGKLPSRVLEQFMLVGCNPVEAELIHIINGGSQADARGDVGCSRFKLVRNHVEKRLGKRHGADHVAAPLVRGHTFERLCLAVKGTHARGAEELVAGEGVEVTIDLLNVDFDVRSGLRTINEHRDIPPMRRPNDFLHRVNRTQDIRNMTDRNQPGARTQQLLKFFPEEFAAFVDRRDPQHNPFLFAQELPGDDVRVMLHGGDHHFVACLEHLPAPAAGHQVDGLRGTAHKDDLPGFTGVDELPHLDANVFISLGGALAQLMHAAMDVGIVRPVEAFLGLDHCQRLLAGGGIIEINEGLPMHLLLQNREVLAHASYVKDSAGGRALAQNAASAGRGCHHPSFPRARAM